MKKTSPGLHGFAIFPSFAEPIDDPPPPIAGDLNVGVRVSAFRPAIPFCRRSTPLLLVDWVDGALLKSHDVSCH
jgi:hypothetical protein